MDFNSVFSFVPIARFVQNLIADFWLLFSHTTPASETKEAIVFVENIRHVGYVLIPQLCFYDFFEKERVVGVSPTLHALPACDLVS
jgi:hypothetical protein